ncbi:MAG: hypothetical protein HZC14_01125 [Candidatus Niyogibacteria bacterium]|nr:hypothetical protein [Candidatus Niyogibacteria bacterium]
MNRKKLIIIISAALILIILGGVLIYYFYIRSVPVAQRGVIGRLFPTPTEKIGPSSATSGQITPPTTSEKVGQLVHLTDIAIAGMKEMPFGRARYIEKSTGHVYEISGDGSDRVRVSNTTIPKIWSAEWSPKGDKAVLGIFDDAGIKYFSAIFNGTSTEGVFLPDNANFGSYAPNQDKILYATTLNDKTTLITANASNTKQDKLYIAPPAEFLLDWPATDTVSLLTRPSGAVSGFLYNLDIKTKALEKIVGDIKGLDALWSIKGDKILISAGGTSLSSRVVSLTGETLAEGRKTLAEKCAWSASKENILYCAIPTQIPNGNYPDDWFKGKASFQDYILKIDLLTQDITLILARSTFDIQKMLIGQDDKYLYFIDKNDGTLWGLNME